MKLILLDQRRDEPEHVAMSLAVSVFVTFYPMADCKSMLHIRCQV